jgi:putative aminopeptidase FrvX
METLNLLRELTAIPAISGREDGMIAYMREHLKPFAGNVRVDRLGNVVAHFPGKDAERSLLLFAHMDELGLVVRKIDPDGFVRFERVGGIPEKTLLGTWIDIHTNTGNQIPGLIGTTSHHVTPQEKKYRVPNRLEMYIDLGCSSADEVLSLGIQVGDAITYMQSFQELAKGRLASKSLDNRIGCALLIYLAEHLAQNTPACDIYLVASVQEELNVRGVWPVFQSIRPDAAICLDVTVATDTPEIKHLSEMSIGNGPAIGYYEFHGRGTLGGLIPHPKLRQFIEKMADSEGVSLQREVLIGIVTDAAFAQLLGERGVPMASFGVPIRYTHAPVEVCALQDFEQALKVLSAVAVRFDQSIDLERG